MSNWWMQFPKIESRKPREPAPGEHPRLSSGAIVRLRDKPDRLRRVVRTEWHRHRYEFVYVVETSAPRQFEPYWFYEQLASETETERLHEQPAA